MMKRYLSITLALIMGLGCLWIFPWTVTAADPSDIPTGSPGGSQYVPGATAESSMEDDWQQDVRGWFYVQNGVRATNCWMADTQGC